MLEKPLPAGRPLPKQLILDTGRSKITTDHRGLIKHRSFLVKQNFPSALLAGCPGLKSAKGFLSTVQDVLTKTHTLVIVHNRNHIVDLTAWFPTVRALILYHNLNVQLIEKAYVQVKRPSSCLERLCGTTPGMGADELSLGPFTLTTLFACCPELSQLQAPMQYVVKTAKQFKEGQWDYPLPVLNNCRELSLGGIARVRGGRYAMLATTDAETIDMALEQYPDVEEMQVATLSSSVLARITKFRRLQRLAVMCHENDALCDFDPHMSAVLQEFSLTHLVLVCFEGVRLSTIAGTCRNLEKLSISGSKFLNEDIPLDAFPKLTSLSVGDSVSDQAFFSLLLAARGLTELCLDCKCTVSAYIRGPLVEPRPRHESLQRLSLGTDLSLKALHATTEDLHATMKCAPALKRLSTDSYDIRIFVGNYYPRVKVAWTSCTVCAAEFPKMDAQQEELWRTVFLGRPAAALSS
ncbi:hypothetical protein V5799_034466 [Amblyomma americanum]|uniref:Uncharacterized protein n=1 Tax=Amblyomma americanum TaxID=6943 RepID=A0AAQ4DKD9_AMBAM